MGSEESQNSKNSPQKCLETTETGQVKRKQAKTHAIKAILTEIKAQNITTQSRLNTLKREISKQFKLKTIPTNIEITLSLPSEEIEQFKHILLTKPTRTISGVSPVAIMTAPARCPHGKCTYCVGGINSPWGDVPQSYTGHEPATMRGIRNNYDAYLQVFNRLQQYILLGQTVDKIEVIVMGGTFPATLSQYQEEFILGVYKALNDFSELFFTNEGQLKFKEFKEFFELPGDMYDPARSDSIRNKALALKRSRNSNIKEEQERNETAKVRCVALCIETKPDWGLEEHANRMLQQGCTRVELGIQSVYDDVLKVVHRGHDAATSKRSIQVLRDMGFKINFHYMPGLPLTDRARDIEGMKQLFSDPAYKPDMIKFYPCMVGPGTALFAQYQQGKFEAISTKEAAERLVPIKNITPTYCRIQRIQRDVPTKMWEAGVDRTNLRQYIHQNYDVHCRCIRCREPKQEKIDPEDCKILVQEFEASQGTEFFISLEDTTKDLILGFCRLRIPFQTNLRPEINATTALVRELHVYGAAIQIGEDDESSVQHKGIGKQLLAKAEEIAIAQGRDKMVVISGVGVRAYYYKLGYHKEGPYVAKQLIRN